MSQPIQAYVDKGCKTCKRATTYMEARGIAFEPVELFDARLTAPEIRALLHKLSLSARELLRPRDRMYRERDLKTRDLPEGNSSNSWRRTRDSSSGLSSCVGTGPYWASGPRESRVLPPDSRTPRPRRAQVRTLEAFKGGGLPSPLQQL